MRELIDKFFEKEKIEYYSALRYSDCRESAPWIIERESFKPRSVLVFLVPYYTGETLNISRYAAAYDYHIYIKEISDRLISALSGEYPEYHFRGYGDHSPIDERSAAAVSGLGIIGKNGLLINEKYGSYVFIADIVSDIDPELVGAEDPKDVRFCSNCGACIKACPTGILGGEGKDCLSAITQRKGELTEEECKLMRRYNTAWGCDECQSHCPYNKSPKLTPIDFFYQNRIIELTSSILSGMDKSEFQKRAFSWRGRKTVERNLAVLKK